MPLLALFPLHDISIIDAQVDGFWIKFYLIHCLPSLGVSYVSILAYWSVLLNYFISILFNVPLCVKYDDKIIYVAPLSKFR